MGALFSAPKAPVIPPKQVNPGGKEIDEASQGARDRQRRAALMSAGRASTVKGGPGAGSSAATQGKALLGQ